MNPGTCFNLKVEHRTKGPILGINEIAGEKVFLLHFIQRRNADCVHRPFFAKYNPNAIWLDDLEPAFGKELFFYEEELEGMMLN